MFFSGNKKYGEIEMLRVVTGMIMDEEKQSFFVLFGLDMGLRAQ